MTSRPVTVAPSWGWKRGGSGRAAHIDPGVIYQGTTVQVCGLFPFVQGSGAPPIGVPVGRHMLSAEAVGLDPIEWVNAGLVTNPGVFVLGGPGVGKTTIVKRLVTGLTAFGNIPLVLGDPKGEYSALVEHLGGQVVRVGRGLDRINALDAGPLGPLARRLSGDAAQRVRAEVRGRRLTILEGLCALVRQGRLMDREVVALSLAVDLLAERLDADPTVPDVLRILEKGTPELRAAMYTDERSKSMDYKGRVADLCWTLRRLCTGPLAGMFDGPSGVTLDLDRPASVDLSAVVNQGDLTVAASLFCTWAWGFAMVDAARYGGDQRRRFIPLDEMWRALRAAPGMVDYADSLTRLNRSWGVASAMITHTLSDLEALATEEDRAKARGFAERCNTVVMGGLPDQELDRVTRIVPLTSEERRLVASWAAPPTWAATGVHPGRGKYLIKTGARIGIPVELTLTPLEAELYDTDQAMRLVAS